MTSTASAQHSSGGVGAASFFAASRVIIVAGKGGVGKTTVAAATGILAARNGYRTVLVDLEERQDLGRLFGVDDFGLDPVPVTSLGRIDGELALRSIGAHAAAAEYLTDRGLGVLKLAGSLLETVTSLTPGLQGMLQLAKIRQLALADRDAVIIVDAPAAGHAISLLRSPIGLLEGIEAGPVHDQARAVVDMLADGDLCQVVLVTIAEDTPVSETVDTAYALEEDLGLRLGPIVVNGVVPVLDGVARRPKGKHSAAAARAGKLRQLRQDHEQAQIARLASELPLPTIQLRHVVGDLNLGTVELLVDDLAAQLPTIDAGAS